MSPGNALSFRQRAEDIGFILSLEFFSYYTEHLSRIVAKRICLKHHLITNLKASYIILQLFSIFNLSQRIFSRRQPSSATANRPHYAIPRKWNADVPTFERPKSNSNFSSGALIRQACKGCWAILSRSRAACGWRCWLVHKYWITCLDQDAKNLYDCSLNNWFRVKFFLACECSFIALPDLKLSLDIIEYLVRKHPVFMNQ